MSAIPPSPCLDDQTLAAFVSGELSYEQIERIEVHLESCADCQLIVFAAAAGCATTPAASSRTPAKVPLPPAPQVGDVLAEKYQLERVLGQGGMGVVYAARQLELGHVVAIKVLSSSDPSAAARFVREARLCARFVNDHVPRVFDVGRLASGVPYFAMEYLAGEDLSQLIARGAVPVATTIELIRQACTALAEAHAAGVVHRDLKPSNLFVVQREGRLALKVLDFGISKVVSGQALGTLTDLTSPQAILGSPQYMSPEQVRASKPVDARSDIWSLGIILYELLTQRRPFHGATVSELMISIATEPPEPLASRVVGLPDGLEAIVARCLEKDPARRFASSQELSEALRRVPAFAADGAAAVVLSKPGHPASAASPARSGARPRRRWLVAAAGAALVLAASLGLRHQSHLEGWRDRGPDTAPGAPAPPHSAGVVLSLSPAAVVPASDNPFLHSKLYVRREFVGDVAWSISAHPELAREMEEVKRMPTAHWIVSADGVEGVDAVLSAAAKEARETGVPSLPVFVLYNLPDRNCRRGVFTTDARALPHAIERYLPDFIEPLARVFGAHAPQRAVVILEPGALVDLTAAQPLPCAEAPNAQLDALAGAMARLDLPDVFIYLDIGASAFSCGDTTRMRIAELVRQLLSGAGAERVRGFASNVGTYAELDSDGARALHPTNPCSGEFDFVERFSADLAGLGITGKGFIIDTSRNGRVGAVRHRGHYCNLAGAGLGERPRAAPRPRVDAYYWVKPPGESDGSDDTNAPRFNPGCASDCALRPAPHAGLWFDAYFTALVKNASPPL